MNRRSKQRDFARATLLVATTIVVACKAKEATGKCGAGTELKDGVCVAAVAASESAAAHRAASPVWGRCNTIGAKDTPFAVFAPDNTELFVAVDFMGPAGAMRYPLTIVDSGPDKVRFTFPQLGRVGDEPQELAGTVVRDGGVWEIAADLGRGRDQPKSIACKPAKTEDRFYTNLTELGLAVSWQGEMPKPVGEGTLEATLKLDKSAQRYTISAGSESKTISYRVLERSESGTLFLLATDKTPSPSQSQSWALAVMKPTKKKLTITTRPVARDYWTGTFTAE